MERIYIDDAAKKREGKVCEKLDVFKNGSGNEQYSWTCLLLTVTATPSRSALGSPFRTLVDRRHTPFWILHDYLLLLRP